MKLLKNKPNMGSFQKHANVVVKTEIQQIKVTVTFNLGYKSQLFNRKKSLRTSASGYLILVILGVILGTEAS